MVCTLHDLKELLSSHCLVLNSAAAVCSPTQISWGFCCIRAICLGSTYYRVNARTDSSEMHEASYGFHFIDIRLISKGVEQAKRNEVYPQGCIVGGGAGGGSVV